MVVGTTKGEERPMIFLTAPPNIEQTRCTRFRVPWSMAFRDEKPSQFTSITPLRSFSGANY